MSDHGKDGGPAFPGAHVADGMSLRDYFAAHAIAGFLSCTPGPHTEPRHAAREAYIYADEMLKAREVTS